MANSGKPLLHFSTHSVCCGAILAVHETAMAWFAVVQHGPSCGRFAIGVFMAIQDYVRSIAATDTVSKDQVFRFLEMQFARADRNHDGELDAEELAAFVHAVARPDADQR
jgi:hypothetical protein